MPEQQWQQHYFMFASDALKTMSKSSAQPPCDWLKSPEKSNVAGILTHDQIDQIESSMYPIAGFSTLWKKRSCTAFVHWFSTTVHEERQNKSVSFPFSCLGTISTTMPSEFKYPHRCISSHFARRRISFHLTVEIFLSLGGFLVANQALSFSTSRKEPLCAMGNTPPQARKWTLPEG